MKPETYKKLSQLMPNLSKDSGRTDNERLTTLDMVERALRAEGLTFSSLADILAGVVPFAQPPANQPGRGERAAQSMYDKMHAASRAANTGMFANKRGHTILMKDDGSFRYNRAEMLGLLDDLQTGTWERANVRDFLRDMRTKATEAANWVKLTSAQLSFLFGLADTHDRSTKMAREWAANKSKT